ncbi:hypothetical protein ACFPZK_00725 [Psychrobacter urativorans]
MLFVLLCSLYFYANDTKPGDKKGDGKFGTWNVISTK